MFKSGLTIGTAIVLPGDTTGPQLMRAMREGEVTTIIGVPRLYDALWTAIETRVTTRGPPVRLIWRALLKSASLVQRSTGLRLGRLLFAPIRRGIVAGLTRYARLMRGPTGSGVLGMPWS